MNNGLLGWPRSETPDFLGFPAGLRQVTPLIVQETYIATGTATTAVVTPAFAPARGNMLVVFLSWSNYAATRSITAPSGWTNIMGITSGLANFGIWVKRATDNEPSSYTFTIAGGAADGRAAVFLEIGNIDQNDDFYRVWSGTGATMSGTAIRDRSLLLSAVKYEYDTTPVAVTGYTIIRDTGSGYHKIVLLAKNDPINASESFSVVETPRASGSTVWGSLLLHPKRARL